MSPGQGTIAGYYKKEKRQAVDRRPSVSKPIKRVKKLKQF